MSSLVGYLGPAHSAQDGPHHHFIIFGYNVVVGRDIWVAHKMAPTTILSHLVGCLGLHVLSLLKRRKLFVSNRLGDYTQITDKSVLFRFQTFMFLTLSDRLRTWALKFLAFLRSAVFWCFKYRAISVFFFINFGFVSKVVVSLLPRLANFTTILTEPSLGQFCQLETGHDFRGQRQPYPYQGETFLSFYIPTF